MRRAETLTMATVAKSWIETTCPTCGCRRIFDLRNAPHSDREVRGDSSSCAAWLLVCTVCGTERTLEKNGIVAA